jgi:hypothetical protein
VRFNEIEEEDKPMIRTLTALAISAATALFATSALAQDPAAAPAPAAAAPAAAAPADASGDTSGLSAALLLGYGFDDAFKVGFGARVGYTLPMHLYIGGTFIYHLGESEGGATVNVFYVGPEVGYEIPAGPVLIRPYIGVGLAEAKASVSIPGFGSESASSSNFGLWPGATILYPVTSSIGVGVDGRFLIVSGDNALGIFLTGQYHF